MAEFILRRKNVKNMTFKYFKAFKGKVIKTQSKMF